jgi:hypothetical protein
MLSRVETPIFAQGGEFGVALIDGQEISRGAAAPGGLSLVASVDEDGANHPPDQDLLEQAAAQRRVPESSQAIEAPRDARVLRAVALLVDQKRPPHQRRGFGQGRRLVKNSRDRLDADSNRIITGRCSPGPRGAGATLEPRIARPSERGSFTANSTTAGDCGRLGQIRRGACSEPGHSISHEPWALPRSSRIIVFPSKSLAGFAGMGRDPIARPDRGTAYCRRVCREVQC